MRSLGKLLLLLLVAHVTVGETPTAIGPVSPVTVDPALPSAEGDVDELYPLAWIPAGYPGDLGAMPTASTLQPVQPGNVAAFAGAVTQNAWISVTNNRRTGTLVKVQILVNGKPFKPYIGPGIQDTTSQYSLGRGRTLGFWIPYSTGDNIAVKVEWRSGVGTTTNTIMVPGSTLEEKNFNETVNGNSYPFTILGKVSIRQP